jgi:hypothetical protein
MPASDKVPEVEGRRCASQTCWSYANCIWCSGQSAAEDSIRRLPGAQHADSAPPRTPHGKHRRKSARCQPRLEVGRNSPGKQRATREPAVCSAAGSINESLTQPERHGAFTTRLLVGALNSTSESVKQVEMSSWARDCAAIQCGSSPTCGADLP